MKSLGDRFLEVAKSVATGSYKLHESTGSYRKLQHYREKPSF